MPSACNNGVGVALALLVVGIIQAILALSTSVSTGQAMTSFTTRLNPVKGFHPTSVTTINNPGKDHRKCSLHLYYDLPALVFVDTNELSQRSADYSYAHWGNTDLEKPVHALPDQRTKLLITVPSISSTKESPSSLEVLIPLHLRYGMPRSALNANNEAYEDINIDWPTTFFRCPDSTTSKYSDALKLPQHVFDALNNLTEAEAEGHMLIPIPPLTSQTTSDTVSLPLGSKSDLAFVEPLTAITIVLCAYWILRVALKTSSRLTSAKPNSSTSIGKSE